MDASQEYDRNKVRNLFMSSFYYMAGPGSRPAEPRAGLWPSMQADVGAAGVGVDNKRVARVQAGRFRLERECSEVVEKRVC
jgi:hypothetical protein